jgi:hypothetical protein
VPLSESRHPGIALRDWLAVGALAVVGILSAAPGVHLFERFLPPVPAIVVSHGIAVALLGTAVYQWRVRRARTFAGRATPG